ncbi:hypothetical protein [Stutzerimonas nitrititolerans]|uniref:hypothetical protein n=1 Tax=Stutzerimonas nitrititolerans TaxID=2482751 RepID=UPI0028AE7B71|nr:hypothetical protein [Stutzerimonas nitrititolerans]
MAGPKVLEFKREDWREIPATLRLIADELDSGELPPCSVGTLALLAQGGEVMTFGFGQKGDDLQCLALLRLGEQKLVDAMLATDD